MRTVFGRRLRISASRRVRRCGACGCGGRHTLDAGGQWCGKAASLALGGSGAVGGASGSGGSGVDHEGEVFAGGPGCLGTGIEALSFFVSLEVIPLVRDKAKDLFGGVWPPGELGESCGKEVVAAGGSCNVVAGRVDGVAGGTLFGGVGGKLAVVAGRSIKVRPK